MSIALDIGKFSIKLVELEKVNESIKVINLKTINIIEDLDTYDIDKLSKSQISASIQDLTNNLNIKTKKVKNLITSLSGSDVDTRQVSILDMPDNELLQALELEAKKHVPLDGTEAIIDYHQISTLGDAIDFGDTRQTGTSYGAAGSQTRAVFNNGNLSAAFFDTVKFSSLGNSTGFGELTQNR